MLSVAQLDAVREVTSASGRINEDRAGTAHESAAAENPPIRRVRHRESDRGRG